MKTQAPRHRSLPTFTAKLATGLALVMCVGACAKASDSAGSVGELAPQPSADEDMAYAGGDATPSDAPMSMSEVEGEAQEEVAMPEADAAVASTSSRREAKAERRQVGTSKKRKRTSAADKAADAPASPGRVGNNAPLAAPMGGALAVDSPIAPPTEPVGRDRGNDGYDTIDENEFLAVADKPLSTFSIDVDTASYANSRRYIQSGSLPPADAVRIEEFINYFSYDYPQPKGKHPFSVTAEIADCPWNDDARLVHVGLQGQEMSADEIPGRNLVFLLDVSGSMNNADKLPLLKQAFSLLTAQLDEDDKVSIVVYAGASGVVLPPTSGEDEHRIMAALDQLRAGGSTNGGAGIQLAYKLARDNYIPGGINRVILATDGDFNVGVSSRGELERLIEKERQSGVFLSVLGFGTGNLQDSQMEMLADKGNGNYAYIDSLREARKVLVEEAGSTLVTIAKDVKIQVEFNPALVSSYRLIGYENRALADRDFNDDTKDAGEIGAGHTVTALYEVIPAGMPGATGTVDPLKYQRNPELSAAAKSGEMMTVKLRYKQPTGSKSQLISFPLTDEERSLSQSSADFRFSASVAAFGMLLRNSQHAGDADFAMVRKLAQGALGKDPHGYRREFVQLVDQAARLRGDSTVAVAR